MCPFQAGFFPGMVYYLSLWFTSDEISSRIAMFFSTSALAGFLGGLIAYGVLQMNGHLGLKGWQWLFLMEGIPTVLTGFTVYWLLVCVCCFCLFRPFISFTMALVMQPNQPLGADFLTVDEQEFLEERLRKHQARKLALAAPTPGWHFVGTDETSAPVGKKEISWADVKQTVLDWRVWALALLYLLVLNVLYSLSFFLPAIIGTLGYSVLMSNLVSAPIYFIAALFTVYISWSSDQKRERYWHCIIPATIAGIFFILFAQSLDTNNAAFKVITLTVLVSAAWCLVPPILALLMGVLKSPTSSATGTAVCVSIGNIGGYVGPTLCAWAKTSSQSYGPACYVLCVCCFGFALGMLALRSKLTGTKFDFSFAEGDAVPEAPTASTTPTV